MANKASFEGIINPIPGLVAAADYSDDGTVYQHCFVKLSGDNTIAPAGDDALAIGVLLNKPKLGAAAVVAGPGSVVKIKTGGAISTVRKLTPKSDGTALATSESDDPCIALALETCDSGDLVTALIVGGMTLAAS